MIFSQNEHQNLLSRGMLWGQARGVWIQIIKVHQNETSGLWETSSLEECNVIVSQQYGTPTGIPESHKPLLLFNLLLG